MKILFGIRSGALVVLFNVVGLSSALAQHGRIESGQITSAALANNLFGDSSTRPYKVYLPPSYDKTRKRYPVFYFLHGYGSDENLRLGLLQSALDSMISQRTIGEMIAIFVNATNQLYGSWYLSSPVIGDYETYIVTDLVNLIDTRYRTLAVRESRGITGQSMGGWGAMHLALKFPSTFSLTVSESGTFDSRGAYVDGLTKQLARLHATNFVQYDQLPFPAMAFEALWPGLLPNPQRPSLYLDRPYELVNGSLVLIESAHQRCLDGDVAHGDVGRYVQQTIRLNGIKIVHGTSDTTVPITEARAFTNILHTSGIDFTYEEHTGGHEYLPALALPFLSAHLQSVELYINQPRLSIAQDRNGFHLTFPTQTGVDYGIESREALSGAIAIWAERTRIKGSGRTATSTFPVEGENQFFRVKGVNVLP